MKLPTSKIIGTLLVLLLIRFSTYAQVYCSGDTPFFSVDLTGNPTGTWVSPAVVRDGTCCGGGSNQVNCVEMAITLDPAAVGIQFAVASGANPGGSLYYQINCQGAPISTGTGVICLNGPGPHFISYCKVGNNTNTYSITSIPGPVAAPDVTASEGCTQVLNVTGLSAGSIAWNSVGPGTPGQYNSYLSNLTGTTVNVTPGAGAPASIQYEVCGTTAATCASMAFCDTITVSVVPTLDVTISPAAPYLCYGQASTTLTATPVGGLPPYTYSWSNGQTTQSINATTAGTYSVTVFDATGCPVATDQVTVVQFTQPITANAGPDLTFCPSMGASVAVNGTVTGVTTGIWSGGSGTYTSSNTDLTLSYSPTAAEIAAGSVTLTLTTTNNGTCPAASDQVTLTVGQLTAAASIQHTSCFGGMNGSAVISATGAGAPYSYALNGGAPQTSNTFSNLAAGNYTVTVSSALGCTAIVTFTIVQPPPLSFTSAVANVSCFGACNGQITVTASGGTPPYAYSSNNGITFGASNVLTGLCAGTIGVVVRDANGCLINASVAVTQPAQLTATYAQTNPICAGSCNGQIVVTPTGGTGPYQYAVDGGAFQPGNTLTGLCAGNHTIIVQDANGCQVTAVRTLVDPAPFGIDLVNMSPSNCGFNNGAIEVVANGANGPFTYSMNGGTPQSSGLFTALVAGAYSFVATDALGCQAQAFYGVNDIEMDGTLLALGNVTCYGGNDGWVQVINNSGAPPITFDLDNAGVSQTSGSFNDLFAGSHIVTIYDAGLCIFTIPFTIIQPAQVQFTTAVTNVSCNGGSNGSITVSASGGTGAHTYSLDGVTFQTGTSFSNLSAGTYMVYVADASNCTVSASLTITEPAPVAYTWGAEDPTCFGNTDGYILLDATGGQGPYQYSIDGGTTLQGSPFFFDLGAGTYPIFILDNAGCPVTGTVTLGQPAQLAASQISVDVTCPGICDGSVTLSPSGGTAPYTFSIDNGTTTLVNPVIGNLCAGTYTIEVVDDHGCNIQLPATVGSPAPVTISGTAVTATCSLPNGSATANVGGGTPGYTYSIDNVTFGASPTFTGLAAGAHTIYTEDSQGCPASVIVIVPNQPAPVITGIVSVGANCNGVCDGSVAITTSGGTGTVQYSNGGTYQASGSFSGLCAGPYTISVTDANGCVTNAPAPVVVPEPAVLAFTTVQNDLTCFDNGSGTIQFDATGGTQPYQYAITAGGPFSANPYFTLLDAGTYDLTVTDAHGCTAMGQTILDQPPLLEITSLQANDAICYTYCDGSAEVFAQGGTTAAPYTYNWYTVASSPNASQITGLCAGTYTSVVLDQNGCYDTVQFTIGEPAPMIFDSIVATNVLCSGACNGTIALWSSTASLYSFDGGNTFGSSNTSTGLCQGSYNVIVQSPAGCQASIDSVLLSDPPVLSVFAGPDSTLCPGTPGYLDAIATGGTQPYAFYWNGQNESPNLVIIPPATTSYNVYVQDANGCLSNLDSTLLSLFEDLTLSVTQDTSVCPGEPVQLSAQAVTGIPGFSYEWFQNNAGFAATPQTTVSPMTTSSYIVVAEDLCMTVSDTVTITTFALPQITFQTAEQTGCAPMEVTVYPVADPQLLGGNCSWTFSDGTVVNGCDTITQLFEEPGCYDATFSGTTAQGCVLEAFGQNIFCVAPNPVAQFSFNPQQPTILSSEVQFQNTSQNADVYHWTFSGYGSSDEENPGVNFTNSDAGDTILVCLTATNLSGCSDEVCEPIVIRDEFTIYVPNAFTPDDDMFNPVFEPVFPENFSVEDFELLIFDRWGEILFESHDPAVGWRGDYNGYIAKDGVYTWRIMVTEASTNKHYVLTGHVTLLR